jgi:hypothetical protein
MAHGSVGSYEKNPQWLTSLVIDPETVWLVSQCLNHYATPGPLKFYCYTLFQDTRPSVASVIWACRMFLCSVYSLEWLCDGGMPFRWVIFIPGFMKIYQLVEKLKWDVSPHTHGLITSYMLDIIARVSVSCSVVVNNPAWYERCYWFDFWQRLFMIFISTCG